MFLPNTASLDREVESFPSLDFLSINVFSLKKKNNYQLPLYFSNQIQCVPQKGFGSAVCVKDG